MGESVTQNVPRQNASEIKALKLPRNCIMRNLYKAIELSNGMGQMELFRVGSNQNRTPPWG